MYVDQYLINQRAERGMEGHNSSHVSDTSVFTSSTSLLYSLEDPSIPSIDDTHPSIHG